MREKNHQKKMGSNRLKVKKINRKWFVVKTDALNVDTFLIGPYESEEKAAKFIDQLDAD
jgi:hypothetical protein